MSVRMPGWGRDHKSVGTQVRTKLDVEFANGSIVPRGSTGRVIAVEPGCESICYMVKVDGNDDDTSYEPGTKGFRREQLVFVRKKAQ